ncbi:hypothetical protein BC826DRAFT_133533 [Russula brevipes]|nr:hypothetical protein BC826DRAFT_133533 [Russula brevipes]
MMHDGSASRQGVYRRASTTRSPAVTVIQPHERVGAYFTLSTTPHGFGPTTDALPLTGLPEYLSKRRRTCPESFMYFLIRRRVQKLAKRGDQRISRTRFLLSTRGVEIDPRYHIVIEDRLEYADDLRQSLAGRTDLAQIENAMRYCEWAEETLRKVEGKLVANCRRPDSELSGYTFLYSALPAISASAGRGKEIASYEPPCPSFLSASCGEGPAISSSVPMIYFVAKDSLHVMVV